MASLCYVYGIANRQAGFEGAFFVKLSILLLYFYPHFDLVSKVKIPKKNYTDNS